MTNDDVVFGGDDPTNDMQRKVAGVQGATDHGNNRMDGQRRTPLVTTIVNIAYNGYYFPKLFCVYYVDVCSFAWSYMCTLFS